MTKIDDNFMNSLFNDFETDLVYEYANDDIYVLVCEQNEDETYLFEMGSEWYRTRIYYIKSPTRTVFVVGKFDILGMSDTEVEYRMISLEKAKEYYEEYKEERKQEEKSESVPFIVKIFVEYEEKIKTKDPKTLNLGLTNQQNNNTNNDNK